MISEYPVQNKTDAIQSYKPKNIYPTFDSQDIG